MEAKEWPFSSKPKKNNLSICAVIRNEAKYLKEWIEFHRLIGVDHFYLYDNNSTDRLYKALNPYIKKGLVTLIHWPDLLGPIDESHAYLWALSTQIPAYENAIKFKAIKETKWLALLNTDEYLVPVESYAMEELLEKYDSFPGIILSTDIFDASKVNLSPPNRMVIESRDLTKPPKQIIHKAVTKLIVRPDQCEGFLCSPYQVLFKNDQRPISLKRGVIRINRYINRDKEFLETLKHKLYVDPAQLTPNELSALFDKGYVVEDQEQAISRYLLDLRKRYDLGAP